MDLLTDRVKGMSWWTLLKELPFDGGPSSTRFVFLAVFAVLAGCYVAVTVAFCYVYIHDSTHPAGAGILAVITLMSGALGGIIANSQNIRHQLTAQAASSLPMAASSTPASAASEVS